MTMHGLYKSTGYWQTQSAWTDWDYLAEFASENGLSQAAEELKPLDGSGWRKVDKQIQKLRDVLVSHDIDTPPCPSNTVAFEQWLQRQEENEPPPDQQMRRLNMPTLPGLE